MALSKKTFKALRSNKGRGFSQAREFAVVNNDNLADTSDAFIVYGATTGNLFYNQNGSSAGYGSGGMFATLDNSPTLVANKFEIR